jgi:hypothetical protein
MARQNKNYQQIIQKKARILCKTTPKHQVIPQQTKAVMLQQLTQLAVLPLLMPALLPQAGMPKLQPKSRAR